MLLLGFDLNNPDCITNGANNWNVSTVGPVVFDTAYRFASAYGRNGCMKCDSASPAYLAMPVQGTNYFIDPFTHSPGSSITSGCTVTFAFKYTGNYPQTPILQFSTSDGSIPLQFSNGVLTLQTTPAIRHPRMLKPGIWYMVRVSIYYGYATVGINNHIVTASKNSFTVSSINVGAINGCSGAQFYYDDLYVDYTSDAGARKDIKSESLAVTADSLAGWTPGGTAQASHAAILSLTSANVPQVSTLSSSVTGTQEKLTLQDLPAAAAGVMCVQYNIHGYSSADGAIQALANDRVPSRIVTTYPYATYATTIRLSNTWKMYFHCTTLASAPWTPSSVNSNTFGFQLVN